jgi:hypothetical protein
VTNLEAKLEYYRRHFDVFCTQQLKLKSKTPGVMLPLIFNGAQRIIWDRIKRQKELLGYIRYVMLKGRQAGSSTFAEALCFHATVLTPYFSSFLLANDEQSTGKIFSIAQTFHTFMDKSLQPMLRNSNKRELVFENPDKRTRTDNPGLGSNMDFQASTSIMAGTGTTRHAVHISEEAKFDPGSIELLKTSILPALHLEPGTIGIEEATAYVGGDYFRERCDLARSGNSDLVWVFIPWWLDDGNRKALKPGEKLRLDSIEREMKKLAAKGQPEDQVPPHEIAPEQFNYRRHRMKDDGMSEAFWEQEYPTTFERAFIKLDATVFDHSILTEMKSGLRRPRRFVQILPGPKVLTLKRDDGLRDVFSDANYIAIWEEPKLNVQYDIGVDVSVGSKDSADWSVAEVIRRDTCEQVCEVHVHVDPENLGTMLYWLGKYYNTAQLTVEMNGPGYSTHGQLGSMAYPYIYTWRHRERAVPTFSTYKGWKTQHDSKQLMVGSTVHRFNERKLIVYSRVLWDEMLNFVQSSPGIFQASTGNDDAVVALMIGVQGAKDESYGMDAQEAEAQAAAAPATARDIALQDDFTRKRRDEGDLAVWEKELRGE